MHLLGTRVITEQTTGLQWDIDTEEGQIRLGDDSIIPASVLLWLLRDWILRLYDSTHL